jgi:MFS superfamily sulfate permease-like transporter
MPISRCWQRRCKQRLYGGVGGDCRGYHFSRGTFFRFGATDKISVVTENLHTLPPVVILRLRNMTALDATGLFALEEVAKTLHASKRTLILCGAREQPA